jgi:hypothetical protein
MIRPVIFFLIRIIVMIQFKCPECQKGFAVADEHAGKRTKCPGCQRLLSIPAAAPQRSEAVAPRPRRVAADMDEDLPPRPKPKPAPARSEAVRTSKPRRPEPEEDDIPEVEAVEEVEEVEEVEDEEEIEEERPRRKKKKRRRGPFADCPNCGCRGDATRIWWTMWGGMVGPLIINHVRCNRCGTAYNGNHGDSNTTRIVIYLVASFGIALAFVAMAAVAQVVAK